MPRQLIYTSAPRGLTPGQSGYCTVARSRDLREALIPRLEKLSYFTPEQNFNVIICAHRILDVRGTKFHVLTRIVDSGHDFTKRRSFLAHHLIFEPGELLTTAIPPDIFLRWSGWLDHWDGEPRWIDQTAAMPARSGKNEAVAKCDVWVSGDDSDRKSFLYALAARNTGWEMTFTNCFQPGDNPNDFDIKAAWPNTAGYESAKRLGAKFVRLSDLPIVSQVEPANRLKNEEKVAPVVTALPPVSQKIPQGFSKLLPVSAVVVVVATFLIALDLRRCSSTPPETSKVIASKRVPASAPEKSSDLNLLLPKRPTWLIVQNVASSVPSLEMLMQELRGNEVFTKDLTATIQTNLQTPPVDAVLFADPHRNFLRFAVTNVPAVEVTLTNGCSIQTALRDSFAIEIPGRFRLVAIKTPVEMSRTHLRFGTNVELNVDFAERVHRLELPSGAQFALRPLIFANGTWIDPLARVARDFSIIPSTILDLQAVEAHARRIVAEKESKLRAYEEEETKLAGEQEKLLTEAKTPEQIKGKDRLNALKLAIPKAKKEMEALRSKSASIPNDISRVERFALFLCVSNVSTEVFQFIENP